MSKSKTVSARRLNATLAVLFLIIPLILFILWSSISLKDGAMSPNDQIQAFLNYFPTWLHNFKAIHIFAILCCLAAIVFSRMGFKMRQLKQRLVVLLIAVVAIFLILFSIAKLTL